MPTLDVEELLHLALHAAEQGSLKDAIETLKEILSQDPSNSGAHYLLGALYAQIGLYDRALQSLHDAVALNPHEHTATFQLGLLQLTRGDVESAAAAWQPLDALDPAHYLCLFKQGMSALAADDYAGCIQWLEQGMAANLANPFLNEDMQRVKAAAQAALAGVDTAAMVAQETVSPPASALFLGGYQAERDQ